ncbi:triadin-like [Ptychodera flava]|uniref:triadin-like n=1 Tax=Ptychodera flava TaxID=63121 RepID=UPI00396A844E
MLVQRKTVSVKVEMRKILNWKMKCWKWQSHLCLPPSCYTDYSFEGLEAIAAGLPTRVKDDSHIAALIEKHFPMHKDVCVMTRQKTCMDKKISRCLTSNTEAFHHARTLKEDFSQSEVVTKSLAKFASVFKEEKRTKKSGKHTGNEKEKEKETEQSVDTHQGMLETKGIKTKETITVHHGISVTEDTDNTEDSETIDPAAVHHGMSVAEDTETIKTTAVHHGMSEKEDMESTETTAMHPGMSVMEDKEISETTAIYHRMSVTEDAENADARAVHHGMSVTEDKETTAVHHGISGTDTEIGEGIAMQPGSSNTGDMETTDTITKQSWVVSDKETTSKNSKQSETFLKKESASKEQRQTKQGHHRKRKKMNESDKKRKPKMPRKEIRSRQCKLSKPGRTERNESGPMKTNQTKYKTQRMKEMSTNPSNPPPLDSTKAKENTDSDDFMVHVGLDEESYQQQMRDLDSQVQTRSVREKKEQLKAAWEKIKAEMDKTECEAITNNNSVQRVDQNCRDNFGEVSVTSMKQDSLAISLDLPTLYNLYRLKQTCLSGSFPDSFEPLLITDEMREGAEKVGLQLKLKATYDQARFDELELFFINRDGVDLNLSKCIMMSLREKMMKRYSLMMKTLIRNLMQWSQEELIVVLRLNTDSPLKISNINLRWKGATLESQLKEAKKEKATLEERCKDLTQKLESTEQSLVSQRIGNSMEKEKLQSELKQNHKLIGELQDKVAELEHQLEQSDLKKHGEKGMATYEDPDFNILIHL